MTASVMSLTVEGGSSATGRGNRWPKGYLRLLAYYRPCGHSGDYPVRQIYQQQVKREQRPALLKAKIPRTAPRQENQKQRQHRREEVEQTEKVQVRPGGIDEEPERDTPQPAPEKRPVDV